MAQATLVGPDVDAGLEAVGALDAASIKPAVAVLMASPEPDDWKLVLSSPALDQSHQLNAYRQVAAVLHDRFVNSLPPLLILPTKDPFVREIRRSFGKIKDVAGMRLAGQTIGNRYISKAYVYRIK